MAESSLAVGLRKSRQLYRGTTELDAGFFRDGHFYLVRAFLKDVADETSPTHAAN